MDARLGVPSLSRIVARLLGLELKMRQYEQGKAFCDAIVAAGGRDALAHVFAGPEALPSMAEIADPHAHGEVHGRFIGLFSRPVICVGCLSAHPLAPVHVSFRPFTRMKVACKAWQDVTTISCW